MKHGPARLQYDIEEVLRPTGELAFMFSIFLNSLLSLFIGGVSSWVVARVFYRLGAKDLEAVHRQRHLDFISSKIHLLNPRDYNGDIYGNLGVGRTAHLFRCEAAVMREYGFHSGEELLNKISDAMLQVCPDANSGEKITAEQGEEEKSKWKDWLSSLRETLRR